MSALPNDVPVPHPRERFLDVAWSIGMRLCRDAIWDGDRCNWLGDSMEAHAGEWKVAHKSFGPDLYSGTIGIALFLARLHRMRPDSVLAQTARGAIRQALSKADEIPPGFRHALYSGWIGIALALLDAAQLLGEPPLKKEALRLVDGQLGHEIEPMSLDVISGAAGAIAGLCAIDRRLGNDRYLDEARRLGEHLLAQAHRDDDAWSWTTMPPLGPQEQKDLAGYSHGAAGIALALLELFVRTKDDRFMEGALGGFAYERRHFSVEQQNWPDFRLMPGQKESDPFAYGYAWCHGAPGIGMSRLRAFRLTKREDFREEALIAIRSTRGTDAATTADYSFGLCHGAAGNAELFLLAHEILGDDDSLAVAESLARRGIEQFDRGGRPWPSGLDEAGEAPGLMLGLAGVGYFYLRMHGKTDVPSLLTIGS